jgi:chromosomal replication initiator protein
MRRGQDDLLQGICRRWTERTGRPASVRYVTGEQFTNEFIAAVRTNTLDAFRARMRKLDLLAIDDVHFLSNKVRTQSEFLYTLDAIGLGGARIVMASDDHPRHIKRFNQARQSIHLRHGGES